MKDKIQKDLIESMKSGSKNDVEILRFVISLIKKEEKDKNKDFSDSEVIQVLKKAIKRNQDAFEQFSKAGRNDLAEKEQMEIKIIFETVPIPGLSRRGIQNKRTKTPTINVDKPTVKLVCSEIP